MTKLVNPLLSNAKHRIIDSEPMKICSNDFIELFPKAPLGFIIPPIKYANAIRNRYIKNNATINTSVLT